MPRENMVLYIQSLKLVQTFIAKCVNEQYLSSHQEMYVLTMTTGLDI